MSRPNVFLGVPGVASLFAAVMVGWVTALSQAAPEPANPTATAHVVREERSVVVGSSTELWALEWLSQPEPICTPEEDPAGWMSCPCSGFAFGEQGHLALVRHRSNHGDERLVLDPFFRADVTRPGMSVLQRWPVLTGDIDEATRSDTARRVRARPVVDLLSFGDYDHDGASTEFALRVGNTACGHDQVVVIGVSRQNPALHVFGTALNPDVPLVLKGEGWESLRRSTGETTFVEFACGDHGSEHQSEIRLSARPEGVHAEGLEYACTGAGNTRGRLLSRRGL